MLVEEKKMNLKKKEKTQASLSESCKPVLISQTRNSLNCKPKLN
jgi:hypothetical protein